MHDTNHQFYTDRFVQAKHHKINSDVHSHVRICTLCECYILQLMKTAHSEQ